MGGLIEKRKRLDQPRQAQDKPARRLLFSLLDGLTCDLEGLGAGARQLAYFSIGSNRSTNNASVRTITPVAPAGPRL
ncbi:hypothetical protein AM1BK_12040 [Neobacillus kokaensis]|uniref:Uncharacterized protein n=1 Tax=Neobacillus kokaensis TaxID=2759023 RepID=A0ABQ3N8N6_9BACI|nr:hypothetical protein AM1BK_12040 [Neobacillus kokaensis]